MALLGPGGLIRSKNGCKTCRIRRVKCDEARPNCKPCQKSGRKCDWYSSSPNQLARRSHCPTPTPCSSLPALPDFDSPRQKELFSFFVYYTSEASAVYFGANFWAYRVLQLSLSEPSIRYAICSLSALHKTYSDPSIGTKELRNYALQQYNHAVRYTQAVLADSSGGSAETLVKGLVACILFVCYENFTGNYDISYMHLKNGLQILKRESRDNRVPQDIVQAFKRLDLQAVSFGGARKTYRGRSVDEQIDLIPSPPLEVSSLEDSVDIILSLCGWMFRRTTVQESCPISQDDLNAAGTFLKQWNIQVSSLIATKERGRRVSTLLRIYQIILTIVISTLTHRKETLHNDHLHSYITVLNLADELLQSSSTSTQFFSFDVGIIFPLFWVAIKCRDSSIRRHAVDLLAGLNHREGAWTSQNAAKIARFVIDVEEDGLPEFVSQDQVEESRRVHLVSTTADKEAGWIYLCCFMRDSENNWYNKEGRIPYDDSVSF